MQLQYRSIFTPTTYRIRAANFEDYWAYTLRHDGEIDEQEKNLARKKEALELFQRNPVRSRRPLADPERFYRNYLTLQDDPATFDRKTLLLIFLYKFARHEWVGISAIWDDVPTMAHSKLTTDKISRYHLCEEFCHVRLFHEMFRTFHLDRVDWVPLGSWTRRGFRIFARLPEWMMSPPAFVTELMGLTLNLHMDRMLDDVLADEPEARDRMRELLQEITADELAHVGQRRNFMGPIGLRLSKALVTPMMRMFFHDIPEAKLLFDIDGVIEDARAFNYSTVPPRISKRSWIPSYCQSA